jgi:hypothetical protein
LARFPGKVSVWKFDNAGNLFAADFSDGAIFQFSANGTRTLFATVGTTFPNGGITGPIDLAFDNSGNLFVTIGPSFGAPPNTPGEIIEITPQGGTNHIRDGIAVRDFRFGLRYVW